MLSNLSFYPVIRAAEGDVCLATRRLPRLIVAEGRFPRSFAIGSSSQYGFVTDCVAVLCSVDTEWLVQTPLEVKEVGAGDLMVLDLLQSSSWEIERGRGNRRFVMAILARSRVLPAFADEGQMHCHSSTKSSWVADGCRTNIAWTLHCAEFKNEGDAVDASEAVAGYIIRAMRASALNTPRSRALGPTSMLPRIIRFVQAHLGSPSLDAETIEGQFGLSRAKLYRLFKPFGGVSAFIRDRRLLRARAILEDRAYTNEPIGAVASSCGFRNISSFNRAYFAHFGESPRESRSNARAPEGLGVIEGPLEHLLLRLT